MPQYRNVVLCGFMGSGKTTVGRLLAKRTGLPFVDMDDYIEEKAGMAVSEIFKRHGEAYFRDLEHEASKELASRDGCIISAGGGTLVYQRNVGVLSESCWIVLLDAPLEVIKRRLKNDKKRPLLQRPDRDEAMRELYAKRMPPYRGAAHLTVNAAQSPYKTAREIAKALALGSRPKNRK